MKIVVVGGKTKADFLIGSLLKSHHKVIVINENPDFCQYLAETHCIPIISGNPNKLYILEDAEINNYDILIALQTDDADNLAICQAAKKIFGVKKTVCIVSNPKNVEVLKNLGVDTVISATYVISKIIAQSSTIENMVQILPLEDEKVSITEIMVKESFPSCHKKIMDINFPENAIISCIIRPSGMVVPNGTTMILPKDKLLIISDPHSQSDAIRKITGSCEINESRD